MYSIPGATRHMMFCLSYTMSLTFTFEVSRARQLLHRHFLTLTHASLSPPPPLTIGRESTPCGATHQRAHRTRGFIPCTRGPSACQRSHTHPRSLLRTSFQAHRRVSLAVRSATVSQYTTPSTSQRRMCVCQEGRTSTLPRTPVLSLLRSSRSRAVCFSATGDIYVTLNVLCMRAHQRAHTVTQALEHTPHERKPRTTHKRTQCNMCVSTTHFYNNAVTLQHRLQIVFI